MKRVNEPQAIQNEMGKVCINRITNNNNTLRFEL